MADTSMLLSLAASRKATVSKAAVATADFDSLYGEFFPFVWRMLWRLGVPPASVADAAQDVFVVVHRRLGDLRGAEVARSWVYGIVVRVARDYRRSVRRKGTLPGPDPEEVPDASMPAADEQLERREAAALLDQLLDSLDDDRREVLVLVELERMTVPEISQLLGANVNTVYTRVRAARRDFEQALARHRARERRIP
jgi:RNA polymerase sigma-70 factor (ECF subfamily)